MVGVVFATSGRGKCLLLVDRGLYLGSRGLHS